MAFEFAPGLLDVDGVGVGCSCGGGGTSVGGGGLLGGADASGGGASVGGGGLESSVGGVDGGSRADANVIIEEGFKDGPVMGTRDQGFLVVS